MSLQDSHQIGDVKVMLKVGADGNGIVSIEKTGTSGIVDTYTITFDDGNKTTYDVTNGSSIASIEKTATVGNVDTYTITLTNGETSTFTVTNGTGSTASDIDYDNSTSGLTSDKVQGAIDEVAQMAEDASTASGTSFDNTGTDLASTNTEDGIKEVNAKTGTHMKSLWQNSFPSLNTDYTLSESVEDYAYIIILFRTNAEERTMVVPTSVIKANYGTSMWYQIFCCSGGTGQVTFPLAYNSACFVAFTNATTMRYNALYNNGNYVLKPIEIFGVK